MEEKLAINNEYREKLRRIKELTHEQIEVSEKFNEDKDEDALKSRLQSLISESESLQQDAKRLASVLMEQTTK
jgi:hypothetical protein